MALTDTKIRNAKSKDKPYKLYDEKGLFLIIRPNGAKWWRFKYKFDNKAQTISFKTYPAISLAEARSQRDEALSLLAKDINPSQARKEAKEIKAAHSKNSFEVISRDWLKNSKMKNNSDGYRNDVIRRFENYIFPVIGQKSISDITPPEILIAVKRIEGLGKSETAYRTLQTIGQVFRYALLHEYVDRDITADLKDALATPKVKNMATFTEPNKVSELLRAIDAFVGTLTVQTALRLAPLVFVRPGELRQAKWADIDLEAKEWRYLVTKTDTNHIVPLSNQAVELLEEIKPFSGHGEYVFQGGHNPDKAMSEAAINAALQRMGYCTKTEITAHGFRAMARTMLHERLNYDPAIIEHQLAHKVPDALGAAYNRTKFLDQRKEMMQAWADYLDELKAGAKVIPFNKVS